MENKISSLQLKAVQLGVRARHTAPNPLQQFLAAKTKVARVTVWKGRVMLCLKLQCHSLNRRPAATTHKTVFRSLSPMGALV